LVRTPACWAQAAEPVTQVRIVDVMRAEIETWLRLHM
jgi:hypothetical protein